MASDFDTMFRDQAIPVLQSQFGESFALRRGSLTTTIIAEMSLHEEEETDDRNFRTAWRGVRFTVTASDYVIGSDLCTPAKGDEFVHHNADGTATVYTALPPKGKKTFEKLDADGYQLLVYAKETGTE